MISSGNYRSAPPFRRKGIKSSIYVNRYDAVGLLLKYGKQLNKTSDPAFLYAIKKGEMHLVKDLLQIGFDANLKDEFGESAL